MSALLQIPKKDLQIGVIGCYCPVRMAADGGVIFQKLHENVGNVIYLIQIHKMLL